MAVIESVLRAAPTGVAAYGISGRTLYTLVRFAVPKPGAPSYEQLNAENLQELQAMFRGVSYFIIDEKSMVGLQRLAAIDRRCRDIFPQRRDEPFGELNVIFAGDFFQPPAVARKALFWNGNSTDELDIQGQLRYRGFDVTIELDVVRYQEGTDPMAVRFKEALDHLREDAVTYADWELLASRVQSRVPADIPRFKDAIHIYSRKEEVREYNFCVSRRLEEASLKG
jgi:PIF1-like helicase